MASTEGSGILETGNLETAKRALDAEGFRHFQILRLVFKSEMTRCAQAQPAKAVQIQLARRGLGPLRGRFSRKTGSPSLPSPAAGLYHALEEASREENARPVEASLSPW